MTHKLYPTTHLGWPAYVLESDTLRVTLLPSIGFKVASLVYKPLDKEVLFQPAEGAYRQPVHRAPFSDFDMSGIDEMLPTIDACTWAGVELPDHGDAWSLPWAVDVTDSSITGSLAIPSLPLRIERTVTLLNDATVRMHYRVRNTGAARTSYLWALHPLSLLEPGTRLLIPRACDEYLSIHNCGARGEVAPLGVNAPGALAPHMARDPFELDHYPAGECFKFYVSGPVPPGPSGLYYRHADLAFLIDTDVARNPWLGVWINKGEPAIRGDVNVAMEPTNGFYDSLTQAHTNRKATWIEAGEEHTWHVDLSLVPGSEAALDSFH